MNYDIIKILNLKYKLIYKEKRFDFAYAIEAAINVIVALLHI